MRAWTKKILTGAVALLFLGVYIFGWSGIDIKLSANTIWISIIKGGYGTEYIKELAKAYQQIRPEADFYFEEKANLDVLVETSLKDERNNKRDLYYASSFGFQKYASGAVTGESGNILLKDLTDLYDSNPYNENKTIREKYRAEFLPYTEYDGKNYIMHWAHGPCGLVYNKTLFEQNGWELPKTTDELIELTAKIKLANLKTADNKKVYPFAWAGDNASNYWQYLSSVWWAQYQGEKGFEGQGSYEDFWEFEYDSSLAEGYKVYEQEGRLKALEVMESLLRSRSNNYDPNAINWSHIDAQQNFLLGRAAMIPTGDWMENEMKELQLYLEIGLMETPVISSLQTRLGLTDADWEQALTTPGSNADIDYAQGLMYNVGINLEMVIPSYSDKIDLTYDFLRYMYSDEGMAIFLRTSGSSLPLKFIDDSKIPDGMSGFVEDKLRIDEKVQYIMLKRTHPLGYIKRLRGYEKVWPMENALANRLSPKSAQEIYLEEIEYAKANWADWLSFSGL